MPTVVIACIASGYFKVRTKDFWQGFVGIILLAGWSMIANLTIEGANYLYLMKNGLPFDLFAFMNWDYSYIFTYAVLILIIFLVSYIPFLIYEKKQKKKSQDNFELIMSIIKEK